VRACVCLVCVYVCVFCVTVRCVRTEIFESLCVSGVTYRKSSIAVCEGSQTGMLEFLCVSGPHTGKAVREVTRNSGSYEVFLIE